MLKRAMQHANGACFCRRATVWQGTETPDCFHALPFCCSFGNWVVKMVPLRHMQHRNLGTQAMTMFQGSQGSRAGTARYQYLSWLSILPDTSLRRFAQTASTLEAATPAQHKTNTQIATASDRKR
jgi:hypothetical protein